MSAKDDLKSAAALQATAAQGVLDQFNALGACPTDDDGAVVWHQKASQLHATVNKLTAKSSELYAMSANAALEAVWRPLQTLTQVSSNAQSAIKKIKSLGEVITTAATILDFGTATAAAVVAPTPETVAAAAKAFEGVLDLPAFTKAKPDKNGEGNGN